MTFSSILKLKIKIRSHESVEGVGKGALGPHQSKSFSHVTKPRLESLTCFFVVFFTNKIFMLKKTLIPIFSGCTKTLETWHVQYTSRPLAVTLNEFFVSQCYPLGFDSVS